MEKIREIIVGIIILVGVITFGIWGANKSYQHGVKNNQEIDKVRHMQFVKDSLEAEYYKSKLNEK